MSFTCRDCRWNFTDPPCILFLDDLYHYKNGAFISTEKVDNHVCRRCNHPGISHVDNNRVPKSYSIHFPVNDAFSDFVPREIISIIFKPHILSFILMTPIYLLYSLCVNNQIVSMGSTTIGRATIGRATIGRATIGRATIGRATIGRATIGRATIGRATISRTTIGRSHLVATIISRYDNWSY
ncbi:unnamed protein product [Rotaria magnacalcarata]|uniref:Uncharacterized protein n=1 Tax=Rotaria magnacalcarata TaxID=392030 RepID=A0A816VD75_9BILA|nr:unnamed protein product [Rotaria magnacalcarata]